MEPEASRNTVPRDRAVPFYGFALATVLAAVVVCAGPLLRLAGTLPALPAGFWLMATLAVVSDARPFVPPGRRRTSAIFPSICFAFAILLQWGLGAAVAVQAAAVVVAAVRQRHAIWRAVFNLGQYTLALAAADLVLRLGGQAPPGVPQSWRGVALLGLAGLAWFAVNTGAVTYAVHLRFGRSWPSELAHGLGVEALATAALLLLSPIMLSAAAATPALIPLVLVPLYAVYRMSRLAAEHAERDRYDALTGLASRTALVNAVASRAAARGRVGRTPMALILLDLDRFQHVNDALGHAVGDRLLVEVGHRLVAAAGPDDLVARLGGDEFAVLSLGVPTDGRARELAARLVAALRAPVVLDGLPLDVDASMGIALYPRHGDDVTTLLRRADVAMYEAKHSGSGVAVYAPESDHHSAERLALLADLRRVLEDPTSDEIAMYYQPQVDIATGEVVGVEALLRWRHPRRGLVDPEELIRVAEQTAVMALLTRRVVDTVIGQVAAWAAAGCPLRASLNVSVRDLHTGELVDQIAGLLAEHDLPPHLVQLEITEGALMADPRRVLATIGKLDRIGVAIALDDFGTGYSSMSHLRRLPLTEVKIDRSFVLGMAADPDDAAIVRSIIELAGALGLRVVAEGVEDERIWRALYAAGCHVAQGWFHARPMPAADLVGWLGRYRPVTPARPGAAGPRPVAPRDGTADEPAARADAAAPAADPPTRPSTPAASASRRSK
ncbi:GGDEF-domain containing protein [Pilimelia anulata]|uniref:GGDEF-domain containing protein n=1 Tax=Pilimelia anulata TaxID=53371 RepID=A0A8J3F801_9ACTN|nr:EAL domain-containing protein [Pilimelia anulata]GGJ83855.1 GGDEF-domain containing protein [Pilimelia anulata]